jgi:hypothetical protein
MTFEEWCDQLDWIAYNEYGFKDPHVTVSCGREYYKDYFEDKLTPRDAFLEDMSNA